jgi:rod shape-determining protein MreD
VRERFADGAVALALVALQTSALPRWLPAGPNADLLLLFVLAAAMRRGGTSGALWGIVLGFAAETFSAGLPGAAILTMGLSGFAAGSLRERLDCDNPNTQAIVAVAATLLQGLGQLTLLEVFSDGRGMLVPLLGTVVPAAVANGALLPAAIFARGALRRRLARRRAALVA